MDLCDALTPDDLQLARLTSAKLVKVVYGLLSVGSSVLESEQAAGFLRERESAGQAFLDVLGYVGFKPGHLDQQPVVRERVRELSALRGRCVGALCRLAGWRSLPPEQAVSLAAEVADEYEGFCRLHAAFAALLGVEADFSEQVGTIRAMMDHFTREVLPLTASAR